MARSAKSDSSVIGLRTINRKTRREIGKSAKAAASHRWLPTDSQPEPHWVVEWDGQIKAAIADSIGALELEIVPLLQVIAEFNDAAFVRRPGEVRRTPESRREHQRWDAYQQVRLAANQAIVVYEQRKEALKRHIEASIELNHSGRGVFYSKLSEYHPRPAEVTNVHETPLTFEAVYGSEAMAALRRAEQTVEAARAKLNSERESASHSEAAGQNTWVDGHTPSPGIQASNGERPATGGDYASPANQEFPDEVDPQPRGEHSGDVTAVNDT